jgi:hypothetical protein
MSLFLRERLQPLPICHVKSHQFFIPCKEIEDSSFANRESSFMQAVMDFCQTLMLSVPQVSDQRNHV